MIGSLFGRFWMWFDLKQRKEKENKETKRENQTNQIIKKAGCKERFK